MSVSWIQHPLIVPESLESREYQMSVAMKALDADTLVVLPTGLGKTAIALIVAASRLYREGGKVLMLAPTKPLVEQHLSFFMKFLAIPGNPEKEKALVMFTGETSGTGRSSQWTEATAIFATPQVVKNDIIAGRYSLDDVTLMIIDECHRAVGNYAYVFLAGEYHQRARNPLLLAMTASPGGRQEKVQEVCINLGIRQVVTRDENDPDVRPYIHERDLEVIRVILPGELEKVRDYLNRLLDERLKALTGLGFSVPKRQQLSMKALNSLNAAIQEKIRDRDANGYAAASLYAEIMKVRHAVGLAESQGSEVLKVYLSRISEEAASSGGSKASRRLVSDPLFSGILTIVDSWQKELHPKIACLESIIREELERSDDSRIIVFATYRDSVRVIADHLAARGIACRRFVGQASRDSEKGLTQKKQIEALREFRAGEFRVLIATSVGEEGLDVPSTDLVVFYEAVPSEIRSIQRKGRTGRSGHGRIIILVTAGTQDETFRFVSQSREKSMAHGIRRIETELPPALETMPGSPQARIDQFVASYPLDDSAAPIIADDRESASKVVEILHGSGIPIQLERLQAGDYAVGDRIIVERKTTRDFADTLVNRDLLGQLRSLSACCFKPVLIVEGEDISQERNIHPNAIRGVLSAIAIDLGISIFQTRDEADTAAMLMVMARREGSEHGRSSPRIHKPYHSQSGQLEEIIAAYPDIGVKNARVLLEHLGSVQAIVNADLSALTEIEGIGEKKAKKIHELSRRHYG